jgi:TrmH family RNA methyltransferase
MLRMAGAFGLNGVILGERCCDPYYRQAVRVSMGAVFRLPIIRTDNLRRDLRALRDQWDVELAAAVLADDAAPLARSRRPERLALLFGNEAQGLPDDIVGLCHHKITIPMQLGIDSLNVAISAGVFMYHFTQVV